MAIQIRVEEKDLLTKGLKICENCEWCIEYTGFPHCILQDKNVGLIETCEGFKTKTGNHINKL